MRIRNQWAFFSLLLAASLLFLTVSCGKKEWPAPVNDQDKFAFSGVSLAREGACMVISAQLSGNIDNVDRILLEIDPLNVPGNNCIGCPFEPKQTRTYLENDPEMEMTGSQILLHYCRLAPDTEYKIRLKGINIYPALGESISEVIQTQEDF